VVKVLWSLKGLGLWCNTYGKSEDWVGKFEDHLNWDVRNGRDVFF